MAGSTERVGLIGKPRTTIGLKMTTKDKLDKNRAPGQCYDSFISQLVDLWERTNGNRMPSVVSTVGGNQGAGVQPSPDSLNEKLSPPVCGALGVIGDSGSAYHDI